MEVITTLIEATKMILKDRILLFLCSLPVLIGLILFGFMGGWIYTTILPWGTGLVDAYINISWLGSILGWIVKSFVIVLFFFLIITQIPEESKFVVILVDFLLNFI